MREILFRGKTEDGNWIFGDLRSPDGDGNGYFIIEGKPSIANVIPKTVGQYTGLTDKNGTKIFEGDIVSTDLGRPYNIVVFRDGCFMFNCNDGGQDYYDIMLPILRSEHTRYEYGEVIGNIYDNPEKAKDYFERRAK